MIKKTHKMKFLIKSTVLEKLKPKIAQAVSYILQSVEAKRPIWIRHHADVDGYCAAVALERAVLPLVYQRHTRERDMFYYYSRLPTKSPYYDYTDATKDATTFLNNMNRFNIKAPLIILCDIGSSEQNIPAINKVDIYGAKVMVIDHHPNYKNIDKEVMVQINPHEAGSTYDFSAGMLCAEIAKQLNNEAESMEYLAAVAGTGDKVESKELEEYLSICKKNGYDLQHIKDVAECLDYESFVLGFMESRDIVNDVLGLTPDKQRRLIKLIKRIADEKREFQLMSNIKYAEIEHLGEMVIARLNIEKAKNSNSYPLKGCAIGILQRYLEEKHKKPVITIGISKEQLNFRCTRDIKGFDVNEIITLLKKEMPYAQIDGGGHRTAGSIGFIEAAQEDVLNFVERYLEKIKV